MKKYFRLLLLLNFLIIFSCSVKKRHPFLQNTKKNYALLTSEQANTYNRYFTFDVFDKWDAYYDAHNLIMYSPLGVERKSTEVNNSDALKKKRAQEIYEFNKSNVYKKGSYWKNYLTAYSQSKDSIKAYTSKEVLALYLSNKKKKHKGFKYKLIREKHKVHGEIIYIKYGVEWTSVTRTHLDAIILGDKRVCYFKYSTENPYYSFYYKDVIKMINSVTLKE